MDDTGHVYITAEVGINHNGDIELAKRLISAAKRAGADAVKFQCIIADKFCSKSSPYYNLFKRCELNKEDFVAIKEHASSENIRIYSTATDIYSLEMIQRIGFPVVKIGSANITNIPLLKEVGRIRKPVYLSTGGSTLGEIEDALDALQYSNLPYVLIYHCTSAYPAVPDDLNLRAIKTVKHAFPGFDIGYSDHSIGSVASFAAVALGACAIEKHLTLDKTLEGPDHAFSADEAEFEDLVKGIRSIGLMLGTGEKRPAESEMPVRRNGRRFVVAALSLSKGDILRKTALDTKRVEYCNDLVEPKYIDIIINRTLKKDISPGEPITWKDF